MYSDTSRMAGYHLNVLGEMGLAEEGKCLQIFTDSMGAEALVANPVQRQRTKHTGTPYHYVRQLVEEEVVNFNRVKSADNAADALTKGATRPFHWCFGLTVGDSDAFLGR